MPARRKHPEIECMMEALFGRTTAIESDTCTGCGGDAVDFREELHRREYAISGLCQVCQDEVFGKGKN